MKEIHRSSSYRCCSYASSCRERILIFECDMTKFSLRERERESQLKESKWCLEFAEKWHWLMEEGTLLRVRRVLSCSQKGKGSRGFQSPCIGTVQRQQSSLVALTSVAIHIILFIFNLASWQFPQSCLDFVCVSHFQVKYHNNPFLS